MAKNHSTKSVVAGKGGGHPSFPGSLLLGIVGMFDFRTISFLTLTFCAVTRTVIIRTQSLGIIMAKST